MLTHVHLNCAHEGCYAVITLHPNENRRLRQTHETFYCPAGHSNYFPGKTDEEKRIEQLEGEVERLRRRLEHSVGGYEHERVLGAARALGRAAGVCPLGCGWQSRRYLHPASLSEWGVGRFLDRVGSDVADHLVREHNATRAPVALLEAGPAEEVSA